MTQEDSDCQNFRSPKQKPKVRLKSWFANRFFGETRTRILAWYTILTASFVGLSIPIFTELVILQVDRRVREDLNEEIEIFEESRKMQAQLKKQVTPEEIFDAFLYKKYPSDKTFLITTIKGDFYRSSPLSLPDSVAPSSALFQKLAQTPEPLRGRNIIADPKYGDILYKAQPLEIDGEGVGVLIVVTLLRGERQEVFDTILIVISVLLISFIIVLILAWFVSGRVLRPIQSLIKTARSISETDLNQRIPEAGGGEMAELALTFNQMMNRLEKAFITQRQLVNDVSHELRTPIAIIQGHLESLKYYEPEEEPEIIALVLDELSRMTRLVEDLLLLARSEHQDFLMLEEVDLFHLTEEIYLKAQGFGKRNWRLDANTAGLITVDPQRITQALMNLVQNAVQHTTENDIIAIGSSVEEKENKQVFRLWVRDTGVGIAPGDQDRIFRRFERVENQHNSSQGSGLGLSIVTAIAETHGGYVELYSQLGEGSLFTLVLPQKK
ncbi:MAG: ATP-binding protein [Cyanobacteria bacterium J06592_8]